MAQEIAIQNQENPDNKQWVHLHQPIFDEKGECVWKEMFTPETIEKIKSEEGEAWDQNYMLIPKITIGLPVFDCKQE